MVRADRGEGEEDEDLVLPAATAFKMVITEADGWKRCIWAVQIAQFKVQINSCWLRYARMNNIVTSYILSTR